MSLKWPESVMYKFLEVYHKHDCLWNHRSATYKNKEAREHAIDCILKEMEIPGLTISDIKNKIKTVRTMYKKEHSLVQKSIKSGMGTGELYTPKLFWFKRADVFLNAVTHTRDTASNLILQNDEGDSETASASVITDVTSNIQEEEVLLDKTENQNNRSQDA